MRRMILSLIICASFSLSACGLNPSEAGFGGAALGAGAGALVGSVLSNGDIARSAGLGAAIGFPAGILISLAAESMLDYHSTARKEKDFSEEIAENQKKITQNNQELEVLRTEVRNEALSENPPSYKRGRVYDGATHGNLYR